MTQAVAQNPRGSETTLAGDTTAFEMGRLVRSLAGRLLAGLPRGSGVEMSDLIQAGNLGWIQAARTFQLQNGAPLAGYARYRIRGEMLDTVRRYSGRGACSQPVPSFSGEEVPSLEDTLPAGAELSPLRILASSQRAEILDEEVSRLPAKYRTVVRLRYSGEYSLRQIGAVLQVNESRACQIHQNALGRLKKALSRRGVRGLSHLI